CSRSCVIEEEDDAILGNAMFGADSLEQRNRVGVYAEDPLVGNGDSLVRVLIERAGVGLVISPAPVLQLSLVQSIFRRGNGGLPGLRLDTHDVAVHGVFLRQGLHFWTSNSSSAERMKA